MSLRLVCLSLRHGGASRGGTEPASSVVPPALGRGLVAGIGSAPEFRRISGSASPCSECVTACIPHESNSAAHLQNNSQARRARGGSAFWLAAIFSPWLAPGLFSLARAAPLGSERSSGTAVLSVVRRQKCRGGKRKKNYPTGALRGDLQSPPSSERSWPAPLSTP